MTRVAIAIALLLLANAAHAQCEFEIEVGDALEYSTEAITVGADCEQVTVTLTHTGKLPPAAMGHNWVLAAPGDVQAIASAGMAAGLENDYLPAGDERVLAATGIIGGGESTSVSFSLEDLPGKDESYTFFCSFPGHAAVMKGTLRIG